MSEKKPYAPPKIFQVELNQEQAILSTCSSGVTNVSARSTTYCTTACKRASARSGTVSAGQTS